MQPATDESYISKFPMDKYFESQELPPRYAEIQGLAQGSTQASLTVHSGEGSKRDKPGKSQQRFDNDWKKMLDLREEVMQARLTLRELASNMREPKSQVQNLHNQLWTAWQHHWNRDHELDRGALNTLYENMQKLLDEIGPLDEAYAEQEDDLHVLEYRLGEIEKNVYSKAILPNRNQHSGTSSSSSSEFSEESAKFRPAFSDSGTHDEAMQRYLDRVGDANIARERVLLLRQERDEYIGAAQQRLALGVPQYQPNADFLEDFDKHYQLRVQEMNAINNDLPQLAAALGIVNAAENVQDLSLEAPENPRGVTPRATWPQPPGLSDRAKLRRTLSDGDLRRLRENDTSNFGERINTWMLEKLAVSKVEQFLQDLILGSPNLQEHEWWSLVLRYWKKQSVRSQGLQSPPLSYSSQPNSAQRSSISGLHAKTKLLLQPTMQGLEHENIAIEEGPLSALNTDFAVPKWRRLRSASAKWRKPRPTLEDLDWDLMSDVETSRSQ